jgi:Dyp-type peroxidase family
MSPADLELTEIQATLLRYRPAPYFGSHVLLRIDDARGGRELLSRLLPHVDSAADWWLQDNAWIAVTLSYAGLVALGTPETSLRSFPVGFREGMAARAEHLVDLGPNAPKNWEPPFGSGQIHVALTIFSGERAKWRLASETAWVQFRDLQGVTLLSNQDFGAQPGDLNSFGYKDGISQPAIEGSGIDPLPGQGRPIKAGEFILGYPGETGVPLPMPEPNVLGRNGTYVGLRKYQSRVGAFNRFLRENGSTPEERELVAAKLVGRWRSGAPLTLASERDVPALGADPRRNDEFDYAGDEHGYRVPLGAHMRRMNPRDSKLAQLTDVNLHRIVRRGTTYGAPYDPNALSEQDDELPRGVTFILMSAKVMETLEFLQKEWINKGDFTTLGRERDPLVGLQEKDAVFTIPKPPVRRRLHGIETFNVLRGGEYLFMPSLSALRWLANLDG